MLSQEASPMPMIVVSQFFGYLATALTLKLFRNTLALKLIASLENSINIKFYLQSRVSELKHSMTEMMLKYVNRKFFRSDIAAFSTLLSLNLLVRTEKLAKSAMDQMLATPALAVIIN